MRAAPPDNDTECQRGHVLILEPVPVVQVVGQVISNRRKTGARARFYGDPAVYPSVSAATATVALAILTAKSKSRSASVSSPLKQ